MPLPLLREEAQLLITLGRTDEARDLLAGALDKKPNASLLQILLRLHLNSGDVAGMRQQLEHHGDLIAELPWSAFFPARACEVEQDLTGALAFSTAGVARFPDHLHLQMLHWRLLSLNGRRSDATAAATAFAEAHEDNLRAQVEAAQVLNRLGAAEAADAALERCIALAPRNTGVLIARARIMISRKDALGARSLLEALPPSVRDRDSIQHKIAQAEAITDALPQAIARLHPMTQPPGADPGVRLSAAQFALRLGRLDAARGYLDGLAPLLDNGRLARMHTILSQIEAEAGRPGDAHREAMRAIAIAPHSEGAWNLRTRYALLLGRVEEAWDSHRQATRLGRNSDLTGERLNKTSVTHHGQMVNEYRLQLLGEDLSLCAADAPQDAAIRHFKARVDASPDATPLGICLFSAMFRAGRIPDLSNAPLAGAEGGAIPRKLFQYWDKPQAPAQIEALFDRNRARNPDFDYRRFDRASAIDYLAAKGETEVLRGFRLSPHPAAQADLLRLALLWHEGGVYLDADDLCTAPLSAVLPRDLRLGAVLEDWMSVGNNFLAVRPGDPIIRSALDDAAAAFDGASGESIWLATGPGAITRAMARLGVGPDGTLGPGIWLLPLPQLRSVMAPHMVLSYKASADHWVEQSRHIPGEAGSPRLRRPDMRHPARRG